MTLPLAFHSVMPLTHRSPCNLKKSITTRPSPSMLLTPSRTTIKTVSPPQLNELLKHRQSTSSILVLKCYASYCHSCRGVEPKYRKIAAAYTHSCDTYPATVTFCQMDYALNETFCKDILGVHSLPFFAIWKDGEYIAGESMGWQSVTKKLVHSIDTAVRTQIVSLPPS